MGKRVITKGVRTGLRVGTREVIVYMVRQAFHSLSRAVYESCAVQSASSLSSTTVQQYSSCSTTYNIYIYILWGVKYNKRCGAVHNYVPAGDQLSSYTKFLMIVVLCA